MFLVTYSNHLCEIPFLKGGFFVTQNVNGNYAFFCYITLVAREESFFCIRPLLSYFLIWLYNNTIKMILSSHMKRWNTALIRWSLSLSLSKLVEWLVIPTTVKFFCWKLLFGQRKRKLPRVIHLFYALICLLFISFFLTKLWKRKCRLFFLFFFAFV